MAKGAFYPELFLIQLYYQNPDELQSFLDVHLKDILSIIEKGKAPTSNFKFTLPDYDLDSIIALGALVHEYYHYLQFTTRFIGVNYYECRFQQFLITNEFLNKLRKLEKPVHFPLVQMQSNSDKLFEDWWNMWSPYQGAIAVDGMGDFQEEQHSFTRYVRNNLNISEEWNPKIEILSSDLQKYKRECSTNLLLETEAEIITIEVLQSLFPDEWEEAWEKMSTVDAYHSSLAYPFINAGISSLVPFIMDYSMQSPMFSKTKKNLRSQSELFFLIMEIVIDKYAGINHKDVLKYQSEIEQIIGKELGIKSLIDLVIDHSNIFPQSSISKTSIGKMLSRSIKYRLDFPQHFLIPSAFIFIILSTMPTAVWVNYNLGVLNKEQHMRGMRYGFLDKDEIDAEILRYLLWGAREISLREGICICPECIIKARYSQCTGDCAFNAIMQENFHINFLTMEWV